MKIKFFLSLMTLCCTLIVVTAQDALVYPLTGTAYALDQSNPDNPQPVPCANGEVDVSVVFVDQVSGEDVFREGFPQVELDANGQYEITIGEGWFVLGEYTEDLMTNDRYKLEISTTVHCYDRAYVLPGRCISKPVAAIAQTSRGFQPSVNAEEFTWEEFTDFPDLPDASLPVAVSDGVASTATTTQIVRILDLRREFAPGVFPIQMITFDDVNPSDAFTLLTEIDPDECTPFRTVDVLGNSNINTCNGGFIRATEYPEIAPTNMAVVEDLQGGLTCTPIFPWNDPDARISTEEEPDTMTQSKITYCFPLGQLDNGLQVTVKQDDHSALTHNTSAIFGNNPEGTTGLFGAGAGFGTFSQGGNGAFGVTLNTGISGVGLWGTIAEEPTGGNFAYALLGDANGHPSASQAYAAALFGDAFITGSLMQASDARLKRDIVDEESMLDKVMSLSPKAYRYDQQSALTLPDVEQHGFLAQEVEEVFPELVKDVQVPSGIDNYDLSEADTKMIKTINYTALIPILTKSIQELNDIVQQQQRQIEKLTIQLQDQNK